MLFKRRCIFGLVVAVTLLSSHAQSGAWRPAQLFSAQEYHLHAVANGADYRIQAIALGKPAKSGYPVLYLLDGDALFPLALAMVQGLMSGPNRHRAGVVLVGVGYSAANPYDLAARQRDYTPPCAGAAAGSGGAARFHAVLTQEIKPLIAARYPVDERQQAIFGHSYGALYGLYSFFHDPDAFQSYLLASPSIWWQQRCVLNYAAAGHSAADLLMLGVGREEEPEQVPENPTPRQRKQLARGMVSETLALGKQLRSRYPTADIQTRVYAGENHGSVIHRALYDDLSAWLDRVAPTGRP